MNIHKNLVDTVRTNDVHVQRLVADLQSVGSAGLHPPVAILVQGRGSKF